MALPYEGFEKYLKLPSKTKQIQAYYPVGRKKLASEIFQEVEQASKLLGQLLDIPTPPMRLVLVATEDWQFAPPDVMDWPDPPVTKIVYWTEVPDPPWLVVPEKMDEVMGADTLEKRTLYLYHELAHAFLECDRRPWPGEMPLWADEWQFEFAAFWLFQQLHGESEGVTADLQQRFAESFEPEADGKTPMTVRGYDWHEDDPLDNALEYGVVLEKFAVDLLARYGPTVLPRFLERYRREGPPLLSDEVTKMLGDVLGPGGEEWLEELVYF